MAQEKQTPVDVTKNTPVRQPLSHKGFYTLLLTALLGMFIFVSYYASQQTQVYQSRAACTNVCTSGAKKCTSGNAYVCQKKSNGCYDWNITTCANGCTDGTCNSSGSGSCGRHGDSCGPGNNCCSGTGLSCVNGFCQSSSCGHAGATCGPGNNCCLGPAGLHCVNGTCQSGTGTPTPSPSPTLTPTPTPAGCGSLTDQASCTANASCSWNADSNWCGDNCSLITDQNTCTVNQYCAWDAVSVSCVGDGWTSGGGGTGTPTPTGGGGGGGTATFNLSLSFQGVTTTPLSGQNSMKVLVTLAGGPQGQNIPSTGNFTVNSSGKWTGQVSFNGAAAGGGYKLLVKGPKHLQKKVCDSTPTETSPGTYHCGDGNITVSTSSTNTLDFSGIKLLVGDLPAQDGIVDSYDISLVRNGFCTTANPDICKDSTLLSQADLNLDGIIDSQDYSLLISSLSVKQDEN